MKLWRVTLSVLGLTSLTLLAYAQSQSEVSLLGVPLFAKAEKIFAKFGNPQEVQPIQVTFTQTTGGTPLGGPGMGGGPRGGMGGPGGFEGPGGGGFAPPGAPGAQGPQMGTGTTQQTTGVENQTLYIYRVKGAAKGYTYAFLVNKDGRVIQISAFGDKPASNIRTRKGITLGDTYMKVVKAYGYPTEHEYLGDTYVIRYHKQGVAFQLNAKNHRVMVIMVAAGIPRTGMGTGLVNLGGGQNQQPGLGGPVGGPVGGPAGGPMPAGGMGGGGGKIGGGGGGASQPF